MGHKFFRVFVWLSVVCVGLLFQSCAVLREDLSMLRGGATLPHEGTVYSVVFSPDGKKLASGSSEAKVWDTQTWELKQTIPHPSSNILAPEAKAVAFTPDSKTLLTVGEGRQVWSNKLSKWQSWFGEVSMWEVNTGKMIQKLTVEKAPFLSVAISDDAEILVCGNSQVLELPSGKVVVEGSVVVIDLHTKKVKQRLQHNGGVYSVTFSPNGQMLASGGKEIKLWDTQTWKLKQTLTEQGQVLGSVAVAFSPDGRLLGTGGDEVRLWDVKTGKLKQTLTNNSESRTAFSPGPVYSIAFSPDGKLLATGGDELRLWDVKLGKLRQTLIGHRHYVNAVAFSPDGKTLVSGSYDRTVRIWHFE